VQVVLVHCCFHCTASCDKTQAACLELEMLLQWLAYHHHLMFLLVASLVLMLCTHSISPSVQTKKKMVLILWYKTNCIKA
jgi:hypothetical protein